MPLKLVAGKLVGEDGNPVSVLLEDGSELEELFTKEDRDRAAAAAANEKKRTYEKQIAELKKTAKDPEEFERLQREAQETQGIREQFELVQTQVNQFKTLAEKEAKKRAETEAALNAEREDRLRERRDNLILGNLPSDLMKGASDIVLDYLRARWKPGNDEAGNQVHQFEMDAKDEDGKSIKKLVDVKEAMELLKGEKSMLFEGSAASGTGYKTGPGGKGITKRSQLKTRNDHVQFVAAHGEDAYKALE